MRLFADAESVQPINVKLKANAPTKRNHAEWPSGGNLRLPRPIIAGSTAKPDSASVQVLYGRKALLAWLLALSVAVQTPLVLADADQPGRPYQSALKIVNSGKMTEGLAALIAVRATYGDHPDLMNQIALAQRRLGRMTEAESSYRAALAARPDHRGALAGLGVVFAARKDFAAARAQLATLEAACTFGCAETEELKSWIAVYASR